MEASSLPRDYLTGPVADRLVTRITTPPPGVGGEELGGMPLAETEEGPDKGTEEGTEEGTVFGSCMCPSEPGGLCPRDNPPPGPPDTQTLPCAPTSTRGC
jgi:hypothetical protein